MTELNKPTRQRQSRNQSRIWLGLAIAYTGIFLTIMVCAYLGKLPGFLTQNDKVAHLLLYAIATFIGHRALNRRSIAFKTLALPAFPLLFTLFTTVEELLQSLSPNRSLDLWDLIASFAGIGLGYGSAEVGKGRKG